ncbi:hypothetical protein OG394_18505 [Kribbella sp. NBC_01245]|uniref:hypothetical protein n=1 Tax=Kribbella sp. NBC_01245 TaxID=2903578 RepID=UPI002E2CA4A6|nr:hypothetical protein [Kribbella sp. NBC_01245]
MNQDISTGDKATGRITRRFVLSAVALSVAVGSVGLAQPVTAAPAPELSTTAYSYPVLPGTAAWKNLATHDDMLRVTQVPAAALAGMSTAALVDTVLRYPLYDDMLAFNTPQQGFDKMSSRFNGFAALASRPDAGTELLKRYDSMSPAIAPKSTLLQQGKLDASFRRIEMLLAQDAIRRTMNDSQLTQLVAESREKLQAKAARADVYGLVGQANTSLVIGRTLASKATPATKSLTSNAATRSFLATGDVRSPETLSQIASTSDLVFGPTDTSVTVRTPRGTAVPAIQMTYELSSAQITSNNNWVANNYPNATRETNSSRKYNCHSYAWHNQSTSNNIWINSPGDDKYWTDGSYRPNANVGQGGRKVSYRNDDHSAITVNATYFRSKWGQLPRMYHAWNYTPYNETALYYYSLA